VRGPYIQIKVAAQKSGVSVGAIEAMIENGYVGARRGPASGRNGRRFCNYVRVGDVKNAEFNERTRRELALWEEQFRARIVNRMKAALRVVSREIAS
jgi:hypothetical protein